MHWNPITTLPIKTGYYMIAILPDNYDTLDEQIINVWRSYYGCSIAWYHAGTNAWLEPSLFGTQARNVSSLVTHWAKLADVPQVQLSKDSD